MGSEQVVVARWLSSAAAPVRPPRAGAPRGRGDLLALVQGSSRTPNVSLGDRGGVWSDGSSEPYRDAT